jgi:hypothetical protein
MSDIFSGALDSIYAVLGVDGNIEGVTGTVRVVDKTVGVADPSASGFTVPTMLPAACVRRADLAEHGVDEVGDIINKTITFNGKTWRITAHKPKPSPLGEDLGEVYLFLRKAA